MEFDLVHDIQNGYRSLLKAMSNPGKIVSIDEAANKLSYNIKINKGMLLLALMLLDREATFKVIGENENEVESKISALTYGRLQTIEKADFIFIKAENNVQVINSAIEGGKIGDLINPQKSSTYIIEVEKISSDKIFSLTGPGIEKANFIDLNLDKSTLKIRKEKNIEYPLGIDIIIVDKNLQVACLPRTTIVEMEVL